MLGPGQAPWDAGFVTSRPTCSDSAQPPYPQVTTPRHGTGRSRTTSLTTSQTAPRQRSLRALGSRGLPTSNRSERQHQTQRGIDGSEFVKPQMPDLVSEPTPIDRPGLFHEHPGRCAVEGHLRSERSSPSGGRRGCHQARREQFEVVGLNDNAVADAALLSTSGVGRDPQAVDVTTHAVSPCPEEPAPPLAGRRRRSPMRQPRHGAVAVHDAPQPR